jgi:hypothetical protein
LFFLAQGTRKGVRQNNIAQHILNEWQELFLKINEKLKEQMTVLGRKNNVLAYDCTTTQIIVRKSLHKKQNLTFS